MESVRVESGSGAEASDAAAKESVVLCANAGSTGRNVTQAIRKTAALLTAAL